MGDAPLPRPAAAPSLAAPNTPTPLAVRCGYCHDRLARNQAVYCASCLAPQHRDCFAEHGRCVALGCGSARWVTPGRSSGRARRRPLVAPAALAAAGAVAFCLAAGAAAAVAAGSPPTVAAASADLSDDLWRALATAQDPLTHRLTLTAGDWRRAVELLPGDEVVLTCRRPFVSATHVAGGTTLPLLVADSNQVLVAEGDATSFPVALTDGDTVRLTFDPDGRLVRTPPTPRPSGGG